MIGRKIVGAPGSLTSSKLVGSSGGDKGVSGGFVVCVGVAVGVSSGG
jgi:hypothetical protein